MCIVKDIVDVFRAPFVFCKNNLTIEGMDISPGMHKKDLAGWFAEWNVSTDKHGKHCLKEVAIEYERAVVQTVFNWYYYRRLTDTICASRKNNFK